MKVVIRAKKGYQDRAGNKYPLGTVAEFSDHLAVKLINYGIAAPAPKPRHVETAAKAPAQNAAKLTGKAVKKTTTAVKEDADA